MHRLITRLLEDLNLMVRPTYTQLTAEVEESSISLVRSSKMFEVLFLSFKIKNQLYTTNACLC